MPLPCLPIQEGTTIVHGCLCLFWEAPRKVLAPFFSPTYSFLLMERGAACLDHWFQVF